MDKTGNDVVRFEGFAVTDSAIGGRGQHLHGRIRLSIIFEGVEYANVTCNVKLAGGEDYMEAGTVEISPLINYDGRMNYERFRAEAEAYCKLALGENASGIRIRKGPPDPFVQANAEVRGGEIRIPKTVIIAVGSDTAHSW